MAHVIRDSFDFYNVPSDAGKGFWDATASDAQASLSKTITRFSTGKSMGFSNSTSNTTGLLKNIGSNEATVYAGFAFYLNATLSAATQSELTIKWYDGTTVQATLQFRRNGDIVFFRGDSVTSLATFAGAYSGQTWTHFQVKVVFNGTTGSIAIRKNGDSADTYSATGLDTTTTANDYATGVEFHKATGNSFGGATWYLDDAWIWSGSGSAPNNFLGDFRALQIMPNADGTVQFTADASTTTVEGNTVGDATTGAIGANVQRTILTVTPTVTGTVGTATVNFNAAMTGNAKLAIYASDSGGVPSGAPITNGVSNAVTNPTVGNNTFTFATPPTVNANQKYWVAILADASPNLQADAASNFTHYSQAQTYGSGFVAFSGSTVTMDTADCDITITYTASVNWPKVQEVDQNGDTNYVFTSTLNNADLYDGPSLSYSPSTILGVSVRGMARKTDVGDRRVAGQIKSSATTQVGANIALNTTYTVLSQVQETDPATSAAWTVSGVNAAQFGFKLTV